MEHKIAGVSNASIWDSLMKRIIANSRKLLIACWGVFCYWLLLYMDWAFNLAHNTT